MRNGRSGQSLVEVALALPLFIVLIAGLVEISQLLINSNRIHNAARVAARFGSNGGEDEGMVLAALNSVTQTLSLDEEVWDIFTIRGELDDEGDSFAEWEFKHVYGLSQTVSVTDVNPLVIQQEILGGLQLPEPAAPGERIVGAYVIHDTESILGMDNLIALEGVYSVQALSVARVAGFEVVQSNGCSAFPIGIAEGTRSLTEPGGGNPYPAASEFVHPLNPPGYGRFTANVPQVPILFGEEGYVYKVNPVWLIWNTLQAQTADTLNASLTWPGNSQAPDVGYWEPGDPTDKSLHEKDLVAINQGVAGAGDVTAVLSQHVDLGRTLRIVILGQQEGPSYRIVDFAAMRIVGFSGSWLLLEMVRVDHSCGRLIDLQ